MEALFLKLLNLSMTAGWLVLAVLVLRLIFRKAPRWTFCLLWGLVALRLIFPFSLESALSLIPSAEPLPSDIIYTAAPAIESGIPPIDNVVNPILESTLTPASPAVSTNPTQIWSFLLSRLWAVGGVLMLGYALISYVLLRRRVATATLLRENIKQSERVDSPFVLGLFRPTIYLPYSMDEGDMVHVIAHERAHIRRGDHWWKPLGFLLLAVYWFNPLIWVAYILFCRDMELACDEKVVANMEQDDRRAYSTALLNCSIRRRSIAACPLAFGEVGVKNRVKGVMNYKKPAFWIILIALLACIAAAVCFLTVPEQPEDTDQPPEVTADTPSPDPSPDSSETQTPDNVTPDVTEPQPEPTPGIPAPKGGADPYADLEPAERAAAFLKNADQFSYELGAISMYGAYIVPVMEYVPPALARPDNWPEGVSPTYLDRSDQMLELLHGFDLSALEPVEIEDFEVFGSTSGIIHVGDARCRVAVWYGDSPVENPTAVINLVFTFSDGTMCAFDGGNATNNKITDIMHTIDYAGSEKAYLLYSKGTGGNATVTKLSTGESRALHPAASAWVECIFEHTPLLAPKTDTSSGEFNWQVTLENGATFLFDAENLLLKTEDGQVYPIGGFENQEDAAITMENLINGLITNGFDET